MKDLKFTDADKDDILDYLDKQASKVTEKNVNQIQKKLKKKITHIKKKKQLPDYVKKMLRNARDLALLIDVATIDPQKRGRVIAALEYFILAEDRIADYIPVVGYLDDAFVIAVVHQEMKAEISSNK